MQPKAHQERAFLETTGLIDSGQQRICVTSPTGGGKSLCQRMLIEWAVEKGWDCQLITNRRALLEQTAKGLEAAGIEHGIRAAGYHRTAAPQVQLTSIHTEHVRVHKTESWAESKAKLLIIDEAHQETQERATTLINKAVDRGAFIVGYTATPCNIGHLYNRLVVAGTNSEMRKCGLHVPCRHFGPDEPDMRRFKPSTKTGEYTEGDVVKAIMTPTVFGRVYEHFKIYNPDKRPTILFGPDVKGSIYFAEQFTKKGVRAAHVDGDDIWLDGEFYPATPELRNEVMEMSKSGDISILCNRFVYREGIDCLDMDTEILTCNGWKKHGEVAEGELIYNLNRETGKIEADRVLRVVDRSVREGESMICVKSQHCNIRVTEGHELHVKGTNPITHDRLSQKWFTWKAKDLLTRKSEYALPISGVACDTMLPHELPITDDEIRFIAWFFTDGYQNIGKNRSIIEIAQKKPNYVIEIRNLLERLGWNYRERERVSKTGFKVGEPYTVFNVCEGRREGKIGWGKLAPYIDKNGSPLLRYLSVRQFGVFWEELLKGDGQIREGWSGHLTCNLKSQVDLLSELAVTRGYAVNVCPYKTKGGREMYAVTIRKKQWLVSRPSDVRSARIWKEEPKPDERVWCVTTANGTIITRRNFKIAILGNCPWLSHGIAATVFGTIKSYLQSGGRILRAYPGLTEVTWQDHGGNVIKHGSLNADREWSLSYDNKTANEKRKNDILNEKEPEPIICPQCKFVRASGGQCPNCGHEHTKRSRLVVQSSGKLVERFGNVFEKIRVDTKPDTEKLWKQMYYRAKKSKNGMTWNQAWALFRREHGYYPPRDLALMPKDELSWSRKVRDVAYTDLNQSVQDLPLYQ